ncbi:MAG TPA: hypothetical protein VIK45_02695 [Candidatus Dormibacteraeota bacterium]
MRAYEVAFAGALCCRFPEFMPLLQEHLDDYDGLLPHVFMGEVTRWLVQRFHADASDSTLRQVLDFIETAFERANGEDRELIAASFLENLPRPGQEDDGVRLLLGPALQGQLRQIG